MPMWMNQIWNTYFGPSCKSSLKILGYFRSMRNFKLFRLLLKIEYHIKFKLDKILKCLASLGGSFSCRNISTKIFIIQYKDSELRMWFGDKALLLHVKALSLISINTHIQTQTQTIHYCMLKKKKKVMNKF